jgi:glycoside/pentoside/hexuronide:cation symporter, GPH family
MLKEPLPLHKQVLYGCGMMGWSILINLVNVILVYFYIPPNSSGLPTFIPTVIVFGIFHLIAIITSGSRLFDAFIDPLIAQFSDKSTNRRGRRIPLMTYAIFPSLLFCFFVFYPLKMEASHINSVWLFVALICFYISTTAYIIPYDALLPEMAHTSELRLRLSTFQSVGYVFGIAIASNAFNLADLIQKNDETISKADALQITVLFMSLVAAIFMLIPVIIINENKYASGVPSTTPIKEAIVQTFKNRNFLLFIIADFSYFVALTIIISGLMYFVTVLLPLPESTGNKLMATMVFISLLLYPIINYLVKIIGSKKIMVISFVLLSFSFLGVYFLGKNDLHPLFQIYSLIAFTAIPMASLNILPKAVLAGLIEKDTIKTKVNKEAMFFAVRYFFVKIAQTLGIGLFATLLIYGKDPGNDLGIRLNGLFGFVLCLIAAMVFLKFRENEDEKHV